MNIIISYPITTYQNLTLNIDDVINICIHSLKKKSKTPITKEILITEYFAHTEFYLEEIGIFEKNFNETAWSTIIDNSCEHFKKRVMNLNTLSI